MEMRSHLKVVPVIVAAVLVLWVLAFACRDYGVGSIVAVIAVVATVVGLKELIGLLKKGRKHDLTL